MIYNIEEDDMMMMVLAYDVNCYYVILACYVGDDE
jgi:hypothetical protein